MNLNPGDNFEERFEIVSLLGVGGMGSVFRADQLDASRAVAIKIPHIDAQNNPEEMQRFFRESKILAKLSSPHIMTVYSIGRTADDVPFAVCEFLEGQTLRKLIHGGPIPWQRASKIILQICIGLKDAHAQGVVHRDLKPENIFLLEKPEPDFVKIIDFGLSKMFIDLKHSQKLTKTGLLLGTAGYISPELIAGKPVDHRCDVYALGCIIFEMLMGEKLFDADSSIGLIYKHSNESPESQLSKLSSRVPVGVINLVRKALAKKPEDRIQDMAEFIAALEIVTENKKSAQAKGFPLQTGFVALVIAVIAIVYWSFFSSGRLASNVHEADSLTRNKVVDDVDLSRTQLKLLVNRADGDLASGRHAEALQKVITVTDLVLKSSRLKAKEYFHAFVMRLECLLFFNRLDEAKRFLKVSQAAFPLTPESDELLYLKALIAQRECNYDLALETIGSCKNLRPTLIYGFKASIYESLGDWNKAIGQYQKSIAFLSGVPRAANVNDSLPDSIARTYAQIGADYIKAKNYKLAVETCRKALQISPNEPAVFKELGNAYAAQGAVLEAKKMFDDAIQLNPDLSAAYLNRADFYFNRGNYEKSLLDANRAVELDPRNCWAYGAKALALFRIGQVNEAIRVDTEAMGMVPHAPYLHKDRSTFYGSLGEWKRELEDCDAELKIRPNCAVSLNNKGYSLGKLQRYPEAIKSLEEAIHWSPNFSAPLLNLSRLCSLTNDFAQADRFAERARKIKGFDEYTYSCVKGLACLLRKDLVNAAGYISKAKGMIPNAPYLAIDRAEFYCLQGMLNRDSGKYSEAISDFEEAIQLSPKDAFIYQQRAKLFLQMKDEASARQDNTHAAQLLI